MQKPILVYLIEDDLGHAEALRFSLENETGHFRVVCARSIRQYRQELASQIPDLVLADLNLLDGMAFDLLSNPPDLFPYPVVVMTSYGDEHMAVQVLKSGALDYIEKSPETFRDMPHILHRALREWKHIQERKQAQDALRESEERYRMLVEQAADGIFISDIQGKYISVNQAGCKLLGYREDEILGKTLRGLVPTDDQKTAPLGLLSTHTGKAVMVERRLVRKDGSLMTAEISASVLTNGHTQSIVRDITERKRVEEALQNSEKRFRSLAESTLVCILLTDQHGNCYYVNDAWCRLTGIMPKQAYGKGWVNSLHTEDRAVVLENWQQGIKHMMPWECEYRFMDTDGKVAWVHSSVAPMKSSNGLHGFVSTNLDITKRKKAEAELRQSEAQLRESEERFRLLVEHAPEGIFVQTHSCFAYLNPTAVQYFGAKSAAELIGKPVVQRFDQENSSAHERIFQLDALSETVTLSEDVWSRMDGSIFDVEVLAVPVRWDGEEGALVFFRQITEKKIAEARLRLQGAALEAAANAILITDRDGNVQWGNQAFLNLTGYSMAEAIGENPRALIKSGFHDNAFYQKLWTTILEGQVWHGEIINRRKTGELYPEELTITPLLGSNRDVEHFIAIKQDISERKRAEASLLDSQQALLRAHSLTQLSLQRLHVLHSIELAITSEMELNQMMRIVLNNIKQLGTLNAIALFTPQEGSENFILSAQAGIPLDSMDMVFDPFCCMLHKVEDPLFKPLYLSDIHNHPFARCLEKRLFNSFQSCAVLPLVIDQRTKGLLLVFSSVQMEFDNGWCDFLQSLAFQITLTLERYELFTSMEVANEKLIGAYEATLEGWSRALELREREIAGHSQRVVDMALSLAQAYELDEDEIQHIRRGALLHDIGKMGIPDSILLKPGPLDQGEWDLMRQHPLYSYHLLSGIPYLTPALDIPYYHHEKWDGSGYPLGLRGEEIPLSARLFAIVDVWDALINDRPYRKAWPMERIRDYLVEEKGRHFDPQVVDVFLNIVDHHDVQNELPPSLKSFSA
jgi:PAS domain S-box-containing protein